MLTNWFKQRRLKKQITLFWQRLEQGDDTAARELYQRELAPDEAELSRELRVAYHLNQWLARRDAPDAEALQSLTAGTPSNSQLAAAWHVFERLQRESGLAHALRQCDPALVPKPARAGTDRQSEALEALALALIEACPQVQARLDAQGKLASAQTVLRLLLTPQSLPDEACKKIRAHLVMWAASTLGKYDLIAKEPALLDTVPAERRAELQLAFAFGQSQAALCAGEMDEARRSLEIITRLSHADVRGQLTLAAGRIALEHGAGATAATWFAELIAQAGTDVSPPWRSVVTLALALAQLQSGQYANARKTLAQLNSQLAANFAAGDAAQIDPALREAIGAQSHYLTALTLLAGTRDWAEPARRDDASMADHDREIVVQNRALWNELRAQLDLSVERLLASVAELGSQGHLLAGLLAYVDRNVRLAPEQLTQFAVAIERVSSDAARTELKNIEGALVARAQATEEAVRLIRRKEYERLRELNDTVLASLGDAIPSLVRAAVYLTLWRAEGDYDPLPDLQRLPRAAASESLIDDCVAQVQVAYALQQLSQECLRLDSDRILPALAPLVELDPEVARRGELAVAVIHLRRGNLAAAKENFPATPNEQDRLSFTYLRFYLAWQQGDVQTCRALLAAEGAAHPLLSRYQGHSAALSARGILQALETNQEESAWRLLVELGGGPETELLSVSLLRFVIWLLERGREQTARALIQHIRRTLFADETNVPRELEPLHWLSLVLSGAVAAKMMQYTACIAAVEELLTFRVPRRTALGAEAVNYRVLAWLRFFKLAAEVGLTSSATGDGEARWRALQRSFAAQAPELDREPAVQPYVSLLGGLLASLSPDTLIDEATITRLSQARQTLDIDAHAAFVESVIGQLSWRRQLVEQFWQALRTGDFALGRLLYQEELLTAFGPERVPHTIQLGMILAAWGAGGSATSDLLHRLTVIEREAPELSPAFIAEVRRLIEDSDKYLRLVAYLREQRYDEMIALIEQTDWVGYQAGSMPVVIAVMLLYGYYKTKRNDAAVEMGYGMSQATNLAQWVQDYGSLLLGYVLFDAQKYVRVETGEESGDAPPPLNAADVFARISRAEILGHNVDRYWAAAHFNSGLQLLAVNQREKAFDAFARSLSQRGSNAQSANLAPLFIHFGLQGLEARHVNRAKQAFSLMGQSLEAVPDAPDNLLYKLLAEMGHLMCEVLMGARAEINGDEFLELLRHIEYVDEVPLITAREELINARPFLERDLRLLAICQELRRQAAQQRGGRRRFEQLYDFLSDQIGALEELMGEAAPRDPILLALKGVSALQLPSHPDIPTALDLIDQALRLGVDSHKLITLRDKQQQMLKEAKAAGAAALDLFDIYLADGTIPLEVRANLVRRDNLAELYRLNRNYAPVDVMTDEVQQGVKALRQRLEHLRKFIAAEFKSEGRLRQLNDELQKVIDQIDDLEQKAQTCEAEVMSLLAAKLRTQTAN